MYGPHVNRLNLYVQKSGSLGPVVWTKQGTQGNRWRDAEYTLISQDDVKVCMLYFFSYLTKAVCISVFLEIVTGNV